jgi:hypothetical protein
MQVLHRPYLQYHQEIIFLKIRLYRSQLTRMGISADLTLGATSMLAFAKPTRLKLTHLVTPVQLVSKSMVRLSLTDCNVILERPRAIAKQFIVLEEGNPGLDRDGGINNPDLGLIEVTFMPIKRRSAIALDKLPRTQEFPPSASAPSRDEDSKSRASENRSNAVGTGLSGSSSQDFVATNDWVEAPEIAPTITKKYRLIGLRAPDPVTLQNMNQNRPSEIVDPVPPRL